ncbi:MAG TPA: hypothetical protein VEH31_31425, partial [Streptosporangiaceae bacterium]|nr:hypothetical protein [Streptosporangiaceae bacterium]
MGIRRDPPRPDGALASQRQQPMPAANRNRYADLLRVCAIGGVVYGHWLLTDVTYRAGRLSGLDALEYVSWGRWVTLLFQVMPVFFLV